MFLYEQGNSLNLTFKGNIPVENPEVVIKGYKDGATVTVNGTTYGTGSEEFEAKAKTFVYQKNGKLMITFRGIDGMSDPEVIVDELDNNVFDISVMSESVTLTVEEDSISTANSSSNEEQQPEVEEDEPNEEVIIPDVTADPVEEEELPDPEMVEPADAE